MAKRKGSFLVTNDESLHDHSSHDNYYFYNRESRRDPFEWRLPLAGLMAIVLIVFLFLLFGNLNNSSVVTTPPAQKEKVMPQSVTTNNYYTTNNNYSGGNGYSRSINKQQNDNRQQNNSNSGNNYSKQIVENTGTGNSYLKQIAENTDQTNKKLDSIDKRVASLEDGNSKLIAEVAGVRTDMNVGFAQNHSDLIVLNGNVTSLKDLGAYRQTPGNGRNGNYWDGNKSQSAQKDTCVSSNPAGWKQ